MSENLQPKRVDDVITVGSVTTVAGAVTAALAGVRLPRAPNAIIFQLGVTAAATDAADTLDVVVQTKIDGTNWVDVCWFTQVLGNGGALRHVAKIMANTAEAMFLNVALTAGNVRHLLGDEWRVRYVQVDADTDASFTFSVTGLVM